MHNVIDPRFRIFRFSLVFKSSHEIFTKVTFHVQCQQHSAISTQTRTVEVRLILYHASVSHHKRFEREEVAKKCDCFSFIFVKLKVDMDNFRTDLKTFKRGTAKLSFVCESARSSAPS